MDSKPFSKAPRLTVYKRELYDCAECINLCLILRESFPQLEETLRTVIYEIIKNWVNPDRIISVTPSASGLG